MEAMNEAIEQLCRRAREGELQAASDLVTLHYEKIFAYFRRLCGNDTDAADLTQKTFFKVWVSIASFQGRSSFSTWIHGIAYHVFADWRRGAPRLDHRENDWWETCVSDGPGPFEGAAERDSAQQLYSAVERLDDDSQQAIHLHYYQELSLRETAEALGIAVSTLKYRLRSALERLKERIAEPAYRLR